MTSLQGYHAFESFVKEHDGGKTFKAFEKACKKHTKRTGYTAEWLKNNVLNGLYDTLKEQLTLYNKHKMTSPQRSFSIEKPFNTEEQNQLVQTLALDLLQSCGCKASTETNEDDYSLEKKITISSV